jgi:hypothetical protein
MSAGIGAFAGQNLGAASLGSAVMFDAASLGRVDGAFASQVVVFDAFVSNVDRTAKNPNMLWSGDKLWLIDHGAALYWQHSWDGGVGGADRSFAPIRDHVLLARADAISAAGDAMMRAITDELLADVTALVPGAWLHHPAGAYARHLAARRDSAAGFLAEAERARAQRI